MSAQQIYLLETRADTESKFKKVAASLDWKALKELAGDLCNVGAWCIPRLEPGVIRESDDGLIRIIEITTILPKRKE